MENIVLHCNQKFVCNEEQDVRMNNGMWLKPFNRPKRDKYAELPKMYWQQ